LKDYELPANNCETQFDCSVAGHLDWPGVFYVASGEGRVGLFVDEIIVVPSSGSERDVRNFPAFNAAWSSAPCVIAVSLVNLVWS
jgi:hypothetical protein